jgi:hypothetical protein
VAQRYSDLDETEPRVVDDDAVADDVVTPPVVLRATKGALVALCSTLTVTHLLLVFLFVAPSNSVSKRYSEQINAWIYPLFEQNWLLFAPNPASDKTYIFARTGRPGLSTPTVVDDWFDITAVDRADTEHNPYPSHATQNMLRRAWDAYANTHDGDDVSHNDWSLAREKYLRNIAAQRVAAHSPRPFQLIQLKVVTQPIAPPDATNQTATDSQTRTLPWWNVTPDGS